MRCYRSCAQKSVEQNSNASNYAGMVKAVARKLDWADGHLNLAVAGSFVLMTPFVYHAMLNELSNQGYVVNFQLVLEPVTGAVELAKKALLT